MIEWRYFWLFWLSGLALFLLLIGTGGVLETQVAPSGILDHQAAGNAARVDAIQASWQNAGLLELAQWGMIGDLVFIGLFSVGGVIGGRVLWRDAFNPRIKKISLFIIVLYTVFGLTDYAETIAQFIQLVTLEGSDFLAGLAATMRPIKIVSFIAGTGLLLVALGWYALDRRA